MENRLLSESRRVGQERDQSLSAEHILVLLFMLLTLVVPLFVVELYPFSAPSMFAHAPTSYCLYELEGPLGETLNPHEFGVGLNQPHDPPVKTLGRHGYGRQFEESPAGYDKPINRALVEERTRGLMKKLSLAHIWVKAIRYEVVNGVVTEKEVRKWKVLNPNYYK